MTGALALYAALSVALAMAAVCAGCSAEADPSGKADGAPAATGGAECSDGSARLVHSGLCADRAEKLLANAPAPATMQGCRWVLRDTPFATDILLYRALDCESETRIEVQIGNHMTSIDFVRPEGQGSEAEARDVEHLPLVAVFAGHPDGRARALFETRDSLKDPKAARRCDIRPPHDRDGLPADAFIVDIRRDPADPFPDDAVPECGPLGYNPAGGSIAFWRPHQGYAWFFSMETGVWSLDPASLTLITRNADGAWQRVPDPS
jgi:hypothetical protein